MSRTTSRKSTAKKMVLVAIILITVVALVSGTYSKYTNTATGTATLDIAKWSVKIDDTQMNAISSGALSVPLTYTANSYVKANKIAPGGSATFTLVIDPTDSEVAIDYDISIGAVTGLTNAGSAIALTGATYTVDGGSAQNATITSGAGAINFTEDLADVVAGKKVTVVGTITWDNASDANSAADTANGLNDPSPTVAVSITAQQHIGS